MKLSAIPFALALWWTLIPALSTTTAHAQPLYWQPWNPVIGAPRFINPPGNLVIGGWWSSPDYGRSDIRICRLSDNLGRWSYGGFDRGSCHYYSHTSGRGHVVGIGFDLLGGDFQPRWIPYNTPHHREVTTSSHSAFSLGKVHPDAGQQTPPQQAEMESLCRIVQADGAFIGTRMDGACYTAWQGLELISAEFEILDLAEPQ